MLGSQLHSDFSFRDCQEKDDRIMIALSFLNSHSLSLSLTLSLFLILMTMAMITCSVGSFSLYAKR